MKNPYTAASTLRSEGIFGRIAWLDALLEQGRTPSEASEIVKTYHLVFPQVGLNPDLGLGQGVEETGWFTSALWRTRHNPCGLGITGPGVIGNDYGNVLNGIRAHAAHLCCYVYSKDECPIHKLDALGLWMDPRHNFHDANPALSHLQEPKPGRRWAEGPNYVPNILAVLAKVANGIEAAPTQEKTTVSTRQAPRVALTSGHHNSDGGDTYEKEQTGKLTQEIARAGRAIGMDVRVFTPDGPDPDAELGDGMYGGGLQAQAREVVKAANAGWKPDFYIETHTEGGGGVGAFVIYPDATGDVDTDVRDTFGPAAARRIATATGLSVGGWGTGVMSEKATGVGADGSRLGIFYATVPLAEYCTRCIIEYGAHDKQPDLNLSKDPKFYVQCGQATAYAIADYLGWPYDAIKDNKQPLNPAPTPNADPISTALLGWYNALPAQLQGDRSNAAFYECNVDFSSIFADIQGTQRGIVGEYVMGWFHPTLGVMPVHAEVRVALLNGGQIKRR